MAIPPNRSAIAPFLELPNKENDAGIEGVAADEDGLYVGFAEITQLPALLFGRPDARK